MLATGSSVMPTYARADVTFVEGKGCRLTDSDGRSYLDFAAGIAVVALGHRHPAPLAAAQAQLDRLWHVSNLYWTEPMAQLADLLSARLGGAQAFFCNSGAEAIETAIKYARKATGKPGIVSLEGSFHGRTTGALAATGQPAKRQSFEPLLPGVTFAHLNDIASLEARRRPGHRPDPDRARPGRRRREPGRARSSSPPHPPSPRSTVRSSASTRCRPAWGGRGRSSPSSRAA